MMQAKHSDREPRARETPGDHAEESGDDPPRHLQEQLLERVEHVEQEEVAQRAGRARKRLL